MTGIFSRSAAGVLIFWDTVESLPLAPSSRNGKGCRAITYFNMNSSGSLASTFECSEKWVEYLLLLEYQQLMLQYEGHPLVMDRVLELKPDT